MIALPSNARVSERITANADVENADFENADLEHIRQLAEVLLSDAAPKALRTAALELHAFCARLAGLDPDSTEPADAQEILLPSGTAISPVDAAACIREYARTSIFLKGIHAAVLTAQARFPGQPLNILYAGCGPLAPLAVCTATQFPAAAVQFTLLDIHERSLASAKQLIAALGLESWIGGYVHTDAATYRHPPDAPLHMVITETMQRALDTECQVAIVLNLAPQMCDGGILIPERISVEAYLCDVGKEFRVQPEDSEPPAGPSHPDHGRFRIPLGEVFEITAATAAQDAADPGAKNFPAVVLDIPDRRIEHLQVMLQTRIQVFGAAVLDDYDSTLTLPHILHALGDTRTHTRLKVQYVLGSAPGFRWSWDGVERP